MYLITRSYLLSFVVYLSLIYIHISNFKAYFIAFWSKIYLDRVRTLLERDLSTTTYYH